MLVDIRGSRCVNCSKFTQYYAQAIRTGEMLAVDCGYCGQRQRTTRAGSRCKYYREVSNIGAVYRISKETPIPEQRKG